MITAYNAYRLKQQKAKELGGQTPNPALGKNLNDPAAVLEFAQKVMKKISNIDTTAWTNEDREKVLSVFIDIKNKINIFISQNSEPA